MAGSSDSGKVTINVGAVVNQGDLDRAAAKLTGTVKKAGEEGAKEVGKSLQRATGSVGENIKQSIGNQLNIIKTGVREAIDSAVGLAGDKMAARMASQARQLKMKLDPIASRTPDKALEVGKKMRDEFVESMKNMPIPAVAKHRVTQILNAMVEKYKVAAAALEQEMAEANDKVAKDTKQTTDQTEKHRRTEAERTEEARVRAARRANRRILKEGRVASSVVDTTRAGGVSRSYHQATVGGKPSTVGMVRVGEDYTIVKRIGDQLKVMQELGKVSVQKAKQKLKEYVEEQMKLGEVLKLSTQDFLKQADAAEKGGRRVVKASEEERKAAEANAQAQAREGKVQKKSSEEAQKENEKERASLNKLIEDRKKAMLELVAKLSAGVAKATATRTALTNEIGKLQGELNVLISKTKSLGSTDVAKGLNKLKRFFNELTIATSEALTAAGRQDDAAAIAKKQYRITQATRRTRRGLQEVREEIKRLNAELAGALDAVARKGFAKKLPREAIVQDQLAALDEHAAKFERSMSRGPDNRRWTAAEQEALKKAYDATLAVKGKIAAQSVLDSQVNSYINEKLQDHVNLFKYKMNLVQEDVKNQKIGTQEQIRQQHQIGKEHRKRINSLHEEAKALGAGLGILVKVTNEYSKMQIKDVGVLSLDKAVDQRLERQRTIHKENLQLIRDQAKAQLITADAADILTKKEQERFKKALTGMLALAREQEKGGETVRKIALEMNKLAAAVADPKIIHKLEEEQKQRQENLAMIRLNLELGKITEAEAVQQRAAERKRHVERLAEMLKEAKAEKASKNVIRQIVGEVNKLAGARKKAAAAGAPGGKSMVDAMVGNLRDKMTRENAALKERIHNEKMIESAVKKTQAALNKAHNKRVAQAISQARANKANAQELFKLQQLFTTAPKKDPLTRVEKSAKAAAKALEIVNSNYRIQIGLLKEQRAMGALSGKDYRAAAQQAEQRRNSELLKQLSKLRSQGKLTKNDIAMLQGEFRELRKESEQLGTALGRLKTRIANVKPIRNMRTAFGRLRREMKELSPVTSRVGKAFRFLRFRMGFLLGGGFSIYRVISAFRKLTEELEHFEEQMIQVDTLLPVAADRMEKLADKVKELSSAMAKAPSDIAQGLYYVVSAGFRDAADAAYVLEAATKFAAAGLASTEETVDALTSVLNAYGMEAREATRVSNIFFKTVETGKLRPADLAKDIGVTLSTAAGAGVKIEELLGFYSALTAQGIKSAESAISLERLITALVSPKEGMLKAMQKYGIPQGAAAVKEHGLLGMMGLIREAVEGNIEAAEDFADALHEVFDAARIRRAGFPAVQNLDKFLRVSAEVEDNLGAVDRALVEANESLKAQWRIIKNDMIQSWEDWGEKILEVRNLLGELLVNDQLPNVLKARIAEMFPGLAHEQGLRSGALTDMMRIAEGWEKIASLELPNFGIHMTRITAAQREAANVQQLLAAGEITSKVASEHLKVIAEDVRKAFLDEGGVLYDELRRGSVEQFETAREVGRTPGSLGYGESRAFRTAPEQTLEWAKAAPWYLKPFGYMANMAANIAQPFVGKSDELTEVTDRQQERLDYARMIGDLVEEMMVQSSRLYGVPEEDDGGGGGGGGDGTGLTEGTGEEPPGWVRVGNDVELFWRGATVSLSEYLDYVRSVASEHAEAEKAFRLDPNPDTINAYFESIEKLKEAQAEQASPEWAVQQDAQRALITEIMRERIEQYEAEKAALDQLREMDPADLPGGLDRARAIEEQTPKVESLRREIDLLNEALDENATASMVTTRAGYALDGVLHRAGADTRALTLTFEELLREDWDWDALLSLLPGDEHFEEVRQRHAQLMKEMAEEEAKRIANWKKIGDAIKQAAGGVMDMLQGMDKMSNDTRKILNGVLKIGDSFLEIAHIQAQMKAAGETASVAAIAGPMAAALAGVLGIFGALLGNPDEERKEAAEQLRELIRIKDEIRKLGTQLARTVSPQEISDQVAFLKSLERPGQFGASMIHTMRYSDFLKLQGADKFVEFMQKHWGKVWEDIIKDGLVTADEWADIQKRMAEFGADFFDNTIQGNLQRASYAFQLIGKDALTASQRIEMLTNEIAKTSPELAAYLKDLFKKDPAKFATLLKDWGKLLAAGGPDLNALLTKFDLSAQDFKTVLDALIAEQSATATSRSTQIGRSITEIQAVEVIAWLEDIALTLHEIRDLLAGVDAAEAMGKRAELAAENAMANTANGIGHPSVVNISKSYSLSVGDVSIGVEPDEETFWYVWHRMGEEMIRTGRWPGAEGSPFSAA